MKMTEHSTPLHVEIDESRIQIALSQLLTSFRLDVGYTKVLTDSCQFRLQSSVGLRFGSHFKEEATPLHMGQGGYAWIGRAPVWTNDYQQDTRFVPYRELQVEEVRSLICVPFVDMGLLVYAGKRAANAFSDKTVDQLIEAIWAIRRRTLAPPCSEQEQRVLYLLTLGLSDEEIAEILSISASTVRFHLRQLQLKLACRNRTHLVATALRLGLVV